VSRLTDDDVAFYVHVSGRTSPETYGAIRTTVDDAADVHWLPRIRTYYGGFSLVESLLVGMREIAQANPQPDYTILLSGQDYPLKPPAGIVEFLARGGGKSFLHHFSVPTDEWRDENGGLDRIQYWHFERIAYRTRQLRIPFVKRRFPQGFQPYGGSAWYALSADCLRYVADFAAQNRSFVRFFKHVFIPDELIVQTIVLNSPLHDDVINERIHYIEWPGGARPRTFGKEDFAKLAASDRPFARKFDVKHDSEVLDLLDRGILHAG
jgi:hypothetical protein